MPNCKNGTKKTESPKPRPRNRSLGWRRSPLPTVWFALPDVDSSRDQGSYSPPSSDTQECRILWRVRLRDGKLISQRETGKFNGETYLDFLKHLKGRVCRSGRRVVMIVDNAKYHHARLHKSWRELHSPDLQLYFLLPYSPELNPIERVWKLTRRKCIHNEYFSNLQNLIETVELQFRFWSEPNLTLRQLCAIT